jgi:hypothetical protein
MTSLRFHGVLAANIPTSQGLEWRVRVAAGEVDGVYGPIVDIAARPIHLEVALDSETKFYLDYL